MDVYNKLQQKLNAHPAGAPDKPEFLEILRILFTLKEAEFALNLAFRPKPVENIAQETGLSADEVTTLGERLADKGVIVCGTRHGKNYYGLLPLVPGLFENPFKVREHIGADSDRLGHLWEQYFENGHGHRCVFLFVCINTHHQIPPRDLLEFPCCAILHSIAPST